MYLKFLSIKNFRQFSDFQVELNKGLNLLIGENNSGKTTLIDAIRLTLDTNSTEWVGIQESDFNRLHSDLHIQLKFEELSTEEAAIFIEHLTHEKYGDNNPQKRKHVLYINLKASHKPLSNSNSRFLRTDVRSGENAEGPLIEKEIRKYLEVTYLKPLRDAENELSAGRNSRLSQILSSPNSKVGKTETIEKLIRAFIDANSEIKNIPQIEAVENTIEGALSKVTFSMDSFKPVINILGSKEFEKLTDSEKRLIFKSILEKLSLNLSDNFTRQGMGYNNLLFMVTELMLLQSEQHLNNPLLLIEEPEAHLHPQLQMKFLQYISEKSGYTDKETQQDEEEPLIENKTSKNIQCILSTHSPNLASKSPLENLIIMNQGVAYPLRKDMTKLQGDDDYKFLKKFLDTTKANMFFAKGILMVEGNAENILLPTIANLLGTPLEDYGVSIVNIGGTAYKRYIRIYQRKNKDNLASKPLPIKVANLVDLDLWPDQAEEKEGNKYGFKERKEKNTHYWLSHYTTQEELDDYKNKKLADDGDNVKTFISDYWTFEYCLAISGLGEELCKAINQMNQKKWEKKKKEGEVFEGIDFNKLSDDLSIKALALYKQIDKEEIKTEVSYYLA